MIGKNSKEAAREVRRVGLRPSFGSQPRNLTDRDQDDFSVWPDFSPNAQQIAYTSWYRSGFDVYRMNADGSRRRRLTYGGGWEAEPTFSPNGKRIVFVRTHGVDDDLWRMNADGTHKRVLLGGPHIDSLPVWGPRAP